MGQSVNTKQRGLIQLVLRVGQPVTTRQCGLEQLVLRVGQPVTTRQCGLNKTKLNVLHVKGENSSNIAGGKNAHFYQLECKSAGAFVASANTSMQIKIPAPTDFKQEIKKPTEPTKTIKLVITDKKGTPATSVHIGDPLLLKITGPADYTIEPISCNASSSVDTDYVMWTNDSCSSKDTAVIDNAWIHNKTIPNIVSISMYGFRFVKSNTVVVTCSALFCPKGMTCSSKVVTHTVRRNNGSSSSSLYSIIALLFNNS
ncbi:uncharacterized protein LOC134727631 [Mytilus trossulus]|uniref:uncharacterized protein LOC134727631 n=1 Tax=Mytilus trossulus TaxID=6551 RepID=UPI003004D41F